MLAWSRTPISRKIQRKEWKDALSFHGKRSETSVQTLLESKGLEVTFKEESQYQHYQFRATSAAYAKHEPKAANC